MKCKLGLDWKFWCFAIGAGKIHAAKDNCGCIGVAFQIGPFWIEIYKERIFCEARD